MAVLDAAEELEVVRKLELDFDVEVVTVETGTGTSVTVETTVVVELLLEVDDVPADDVVGGDATALVLTVVRELKVELEELTPHDPKPN